MHAAIDEVLDILHRTGLDLVNGNSNHGPMAAEVLFALGRPDAVLPWLEKYKSRFQDRLPTRTPLAPGDWQASLGDRSRSSDWVAFFDRELAEAPWQAVLQAWVPRLAPRLRAVATHGVIRTGHAVRSLAASTTPQRLHSDLTETCAGIYLTNPQVLIAFVHTVTAPSAPRTLAPYLTDADAWLAARYAWQARAAIYSWYSTTPPPATTERMLSTEAPEVLIDRAVVAGGAHTIQFTEACLREYGLNPKPVYLVAARDAAERVGPI